MADTDSSKVQGATADEMTEATTMAAHTRNFSTLLNGMQIDGAAFKADLRRMMKGRGKLASR